MIPDPLKILVADYQRVLESRLNPNIVQVVARATALYRSHPHPRSNRMPPNPQSPNTTPITPNSLFNNYRTHAQPQTNHFPHPHYKRRTSAKLSQVWQPSCSHLIPLFVTLMAHINACPFKAQSTKGAKTAGEATTLKRAAIRATLLIYTNRNQIWFEFNRVAIQLTNKKTRVGKEVPDLPEKQLPSPQLIKLI